MTAEPTLPDPPSAGPADPGPVRRRPAAVARGAAAGLAVIVPVSVAVEALDRGGREGSPWLLVPFAAVLGAYFLAGRVAARRADVAPVLHGIAAGLTAFGAWLVLRTAVPAVRGEEVGFGTRAVLTNALLAGAFAALGATTGEPARRDADARPASGRG